MTAQLLLGLTILVGVHEIGHLVAAKAFGMRVEKFSIGFPPKLFGIKWGQTEYSIGALPLGGFVKISGMVDESLDTRQLRSEPQPWEYRAKPAWQRLIVMLGGVTVNVITGILIFVMMAWYNGESFYPITEVNKHGILPNELAENIGLQRGDRIVAMNGQPFTNFSDVINPKFLLEKNGSYTVEREGIRLDIPIPANLLDALSEQNVSGAFISPLLPYKVGQVIAGGNAEKGGLKEGDIVLAVNGQPVNYFQDLRATLAENKGTTIQMTVERQTEGAPVKDAVKLQVEVSEEGTIGFFPEMLLKMDRRELSFGESLSKGTFEAFDVIIVQIKAFSKMFSGDVSVSKSLSGPIGIAQVFGGYWDWQRFWAITGLLSMVLAFMNLLPIPALDGGHVVFLLFEMITGTPPSEKFLEGAQRVGMVLLLCLMVFAFGNDIMKFFF